MNVCVCVHALCLCVCVCVFVHACYVKSIEIIWNAGKNQREQACYFQYYLYFPKW